jgi:hypothetical protein
MLCSQLGVASWSHAQFATVINVPPQAAPAAIGSDTQLNLAAGGSIGNSFNAGATNGSSSEVEVNIAGGSVGYDFMAHNGSTVNVTGGTVGSGLTAKSGGTVNISGGTVDTALTAASGGTVNITGGYAGPFMAAQSGGLMNIHAGPISKLVRFDGGSDVNLYGGDFRLNGQLLGGLDVYGNLVALPMDFEAILSGTLADGTPFALAAYDGDEIWNATITLHAAPTPAIGPDHIQASVDPVPKGIRQGQTLVVDEGAFLGTDVSAGFGSTVHIDGGYMNSFFEAVGGTVTMTAGQMGGQNGIFDGSRFDISGGEVGSTVVLDSEVNMSGGIVSGYLTVASGATANISGGEIQHGLITWPGATSNVSAGTIHHESRVDETATVNITGGDFDSFHYVGGEMNISGGSVGTNASETFVVGRVNLTGGTLGDRFTAANEARLRVAGGSLGNDLSLEGESVTSISAGSVGDNVSLNGSAKIDMSGGSIGNHASLTGFNSKLGIAAGSVGEHLTVDEYGSEVTISGGLVGDYLTATRGRINISGGTIGDAFHTGTTSDSRVFLYGTQFHLNGLPIAGLTPGQPDQIDTRNVTLSGILLDGTPFSFDLNSTANPELDFFATSARVTVQLVSGLPGDYTGDGSVDAADYVVWRKMLGTTTNHGAGADGDFSGAVDELDYFIMRRNLGRTMPGAGGGQNDLVPEPSAWFLIVAACLVTMSRRVVR